MRHLLITSLALCGLAAAQGSFAVATHALPGPLGAFQFNTKASLWTATIQNAPNQILGGSLWSNKSALLAVANPVQLVLGGSPPSVRPVVLVEEALATTYHGLGVDGAWYSQFVPTLASNVTFADDLVAFTSGPTVYVFNVWQRAWTTQVFATPSPVLRSARSIVAVIDNTDLYAFSSFGHGAVRLQTGYPMITQVPGSGATDTDRSVMAFVTGGNEIAIFSAFRQTWTRLTTANPASGVPAVFNKSVAFFTDGNTLHLYSALTGRVTSLALADMGQVTATSEDSGVDIQDMSAQQFTVFRGIDNGVVTVSGVLPPPASSIRRDNDWRVLQQGSRFDAVSTTVKGAAFVSIDLGAETLVSAQGNDCMLIIQTDAALYGYTSCLNLWTRHAYTGSLTVPRPQDFIGHAYSSNLLHVFVARDGAWITRPLAANATIGDTDSMVYTKESGVYTVVTCDDPTFRAQVLSTGTKLTDGSDDNSLFSIHDDPAGPGSVVHHFARLGGKWTTLTTAHRFTSVAGEVRRFDEGLALLTPTAIVTFSAFADLCVQLPHPLDNVDHHALTDMRTRFVASAEPFDSIFLMLSLGRGEIPIPGISGCPFLLDPLRPLFLFLIGTCDGRGVLQFDLTLPDSPSVLYLQLLGIGTPLAEFGRRLTLQVH